MAKTKSHNDTRRGQPYKFLPFTPNASDPETVFVALNKKFIFSSNLVRTFYIVRYVGLKNVKQFAQTLHESTSEEGVHQAIHGEFSHAIPNYFIIRDFETCLGVLGGIEYPDYVTIPKGIHSNNRDVLNSYFYVDYLLAESGRNSLPFIEDLIGAMYSDRVDDCLTGLADYNLFSSSAPLKHFDDKHDLRNYIIASVMYSVSYLPVCPAFTNPTVFGADYATRNSDHSADANSQQYSSTP
jgi:hypothetical protein